MKPMKPLKLPPTGYRELNPLETIIQGDLFYGQDPPNDPPKLHPSLSIGYTPSRSVHGYRYFRKIKVI